MVNDYAKYREKWHSINLRKETWATAKTVSESMGLRMHELISMSLAYYMAHKKGEIAAAIKARQSLRQMQEESVLRDLKGG